MASKLALLLVLMGAVSAQNSCGTSQIDQLAGFGAGTTGGGSGEGTTVTSCSELEDALSSGGVIKVSGVLTGCGALKVPSDTTVIGVGAASGLTNGGLRVLNADNVIIRNLVFKDAEGIDQVGIQAATNVWIDHNDFSSEGITGDKDFYDGLVDVTHASDGITISWNKFHDHWKASLVGHSDNNGDEDTGHLTVTYHHNYWYNLNSRLPSFRFGTGHIYSSCFESSNDGIHVRKGANVLVEASAFTNVDNAIYTNNDSDDTGYATSKDNLLTDSTEDIGSTSDFTPSYSYTVDPADCVCDLVKAEAGTGIVS